MIYFAFVHSQLLYGIEVYANTWPNHLSKLITLNNKLLRIFKRNLADHTVLNYTKLTIHFQYSYYITFRFWLLCISMSIIELNYVCILWIFWWK